MWALITFYAILLLTLLLALRKNRKNHEESDQWRDAFNTELTTTTELRKRYNASYIELCLQRCTNARLARRIHAQRVVIKRLKAQKAGD